MKTIFAFVCVLFTMVCTAENFYNLTEGQTLVYDYHNIMAYSGGEHSMTNVTNGRMIAKVIGNMETNGNTYAVIETTYENIFGVPPQKGFMRQDDTGVYIGMDIAGEFRESAIVRYPLEVGRSWDYFDGEKGTRRIAAIGPMKLGERTFERCITIERTFGDVEKDKLWTHTSYYVEGIGEVRMYMKRVMGPTLTETTTTIASP